MIQYGDGDQNLQDIQQGEVQKAKKSQPTKQLSKIINNRYMNKTIYSLFIQKRYKQCILILDNTTPDQFKLYMRALIQKDQFRFETSLNLLSECLLLNKFNFNYLKNIAKNFYLLGKYKSSLEAAKDAYKINSHQYEIFYIMGKISLALNDVENALTHFQHSLSKEQNEQAFLQIAKIQMKKNKYTKAAQTIKKALNFSQQNPQLFEILGQIYLQIGRKQQAKGYFQTALSKDQYRYHSLLSHGTLALEKQQLQQAIKNYREAYKISQNSASLWNNIGLYLLERKKTTLAYSCLKRALYLDPFRWELHANLALILITHKKFLTAHIHLRSALQINKDPYLFNLLGICLSYLDDNKNALKAFQQAYLRQDTNIEIVCNYAIALMKGGQKQKAKKIYDSHLVLMKKEGSEQKIKQVAEYLRR